MSERTADQIASTIKGKALGPMQKYLNEWRREILAEAAERAWMWFTGKHKEANYPPTPDQLRRAVMGEEVEG